MKPTFFMLCPRCQCETPTDSQLVLTQSQAWWRGRLLRLTASELKILRALVDHAGAYMSYRALYDILHYPGFLAGVGSKGHFANMRSFIKRLRIKFRQVDPTFRSIINANALGYAWREDIAIIKEKTSGHQPQLKTDARNTAPSETGGVTMLAVGPQLVADDSPAPAARPVPVRA